MSVYCAPAVAPKAVEHAILVLGPPVQAASAAAALRSGISGARVAEMHDRKSFRDALSGGNWSIAIVSFDLVGYSGAEAIRDVRGASTAKIIAVGTAPPTAEVVAAIRSGAEDFMDRERLQDLGPAVARLLTAPAAAQPGSSGEEVRFVQAIAWLAERHAMVLFDKNWLVTACSRGVACVLGYQAAELVGQPLEVLFAGVPDAALPLRLRRPNEAQPFRDSGWMVRRDGLCMWAEISCVADTDAQGRAHRFCLTIRDATLQYRASQSMRGQADAAAEAAAARNLFLGSVAHELRAALSPISTSAKLLQRQPLDPGRHERLVGIIRRNTASAARLLEDLLTFSTASNEKLVMRWDSVNLHQLLLECMDVARQQVSAAAVDLHIEFLATQEEAVLNCDADRIRQVIVNLLGNAIKFTPPGGSIRVQTVSGAEGFSISVSDTGVGIDPAILPFIFDPFEQGGAEVTSRFGGYGLGLAICAAIARQHGGKIDAASAGPGKGATFRLCLPAAHDRFASRARDPREPVALHVLYVEDNQDAADAMRYALNTLGWTMAHAPTCASARALVAAKGDAFDVVLADLGLPDGSGLELGSELCGRLPIVALTAYGAPLVMQGFTSQLIKPAEIVEVQRALLRAVAVHRSKSAA